MDEQPKSVSEDELFGRYRLVARIATGGMGEIHLARLEGAGGFEKLLVIKRLLPELVASEEFRAMFVNEARIAAQLSHPNICDIYDLGQVDQQYFLAMQYLQGVSMARIARDDAAVDATHVRLVAGLIEQACAGLHHAHELADADGRGYQLVHRDVSPSNLIATFDGALKVLDFGIATMQGVPRMTSKGSIRGKFAYMSPEQISGQELDRRSDVFSLGIVLYEALTRKRLFERPSEFLIARAILEEDYPDAHADAPAVPPTLAAVVARAMARRTDDRYPTARAMADDLRAAMKPYGGGLAPAEIGEHLRQRFADDLAVQRGQYEQATAQFDRVSMDTESLSGPPPQRTAATLALRPQPPIVTPSPEPPAPRRVSRALLALLAVAALGAAVAIAAVRSAAPGASAAAEADAAAAPPIDAAPVAPDAAPVAPDAAPAPPDAAPAPVPPRRRPTPRAEPPGFLNIESRPYAVIWVDGKRIDQTPIPRLALPPGVHSVRARLQDGRERTFKVRIRSRKETRKRLVDW